MWLRRLDFANGIGIFAVAVLAGCVQVRSWKTSAEYPPKQTVPLAQVDRKHKNLFLKAVATSGAVYRIYAPNLVAMSDDLGGKRLVFIVGEAREAAERKPFKLGQTVQVFAVVRDRLDPEWDRGLVPAVPEKDLQTMKGAASIEAYKIVGSN